MLERLKKLARMDGNMKKELTHFDEIFLGAKVDLIMDAVLTDPVEDGQTSFPLILSGYLVDYDHMFYYLGNRENNIDESVQISKVVSVKLSTEEKNEVDYLDSIPVPDDDKFN